MARSISASVNEYTALRRWTEAVERLGVLVFHAKGIDLSIMRGISISERLFPVICLNIKDTPRGRAFSLIHELVHIALEKSGICDMPYMEEEEESRFGNQHKKTEAYCNMVAGEVLVPREALLENEIVSGEPKKLIWEDWELKELADRFKISQEVILRRLLTLKRTTKDFYEWKRQKFLELYRMLSKKKTWLATLP
ncbi:MAG: hypothetical protein PWP72_588 [Thermoanaerobacter sp.]|jgi:Zn-dependent peptidase ImmA (M78 family)|nr:hypothetical protein [Thermoanaerobacter sp.]